MIYLVYEVGSTRNGDRNGGMIECDDLEDARKEAKKVKRNTPSCGKITIIEGTEIEDFSW